ncbi:hypothetical protein GCM10011531_27150 [Aquaticitalea lipolytica]|uniref:HTH araC/xylS-type domain-containing protein n=2 Tax=Aquaticitalea lipolytica TaxID=1247562 RepID=A0A8J2XHA5_9FLAO|nr:hypothetical protein GCM10011531_27150 [Aquaticitalea lipolytica]
MDAKFIFKKHIFLIFVIQLLTYSIVSYRVLNIKRDTKDEIKPTSSLKFLTTIMLLFASSVLLLYISTSVFKVKGVNLTNLVVFFLVVFVTALEMQMLKGLKATFNFIEPKKYKNSNLQSQSINDLGNQLNQLLIDEKVYLNPNLKADDLASMLKISRHQLSEFVNQELDCSFNELVNKYRVEYIKHDLLNKEKNHLSISGLAQDAGFKSDATFYRVFKEQTGFTPSEYIKLNA